MERSALLTRRQREVLERFGQGGMTIKEIAAEMGIAYDTVRKHLRHATQRLGASTPAQAVYLITSQACEVPDHKHYLLDLQQDRVEILTRNFS